MSKPFVMATLALSLVATAACSSQSAKNDIGLVDTQRVVTHWPKFINYQNQINADIATIQQSKTSDSEKRRQIAEVQHRFQQSQSELTNDVKDAAQQVAGTRHLKYVFSRQFIGYGGVDITDDVEKLLKIDEKAGK